MSHRRCESHSGVCAPGSLGHPCRRPGLARWGEHEADLLASCYRRAVEVAGDLGAKTMAFPAISTGIFGFPKELAANIAVSTLRGLSTGVDQVILVAFDAQTMSIYERLLAVPVIADT